MNGLVNKLKYYGFSSFIGKIREEISAVWLTSKNMKKEDGVDRSRFFLLLDMLYCTIRYGSDVYNYRSMKFYKLNHYGRNEFITNLRNEKLIKLFDKGAHKLFLNKAEFNNNIIEFRIFI